MLDQAMNDMVQSRAFFGGQTHKWELVRTDPIRGGQMSVLLTDGIAERILRDRLDHHRFETEHKEFES